MAETGVRVTYIDEGKWLRLHAEEERERKDIERVTGFVVK